MGHQLDVVLDRCATKDGCTRPSG
ncbi:uncharacterized protein METZ01_LOCUS119741 [marine metagenome]|uniref:Uncharacterized protein n=1 Tax=marine metagenome TaxID=408172 RepID=A0A381XRR5_9ZZZZ